jgi:hypothetical protein
VPTSAPKRVSSRAKSNHQRGYRIRNTIISAVAMASPAVIPPPVVRICSPVCVTTVSLPVAVSRARMMTIGMIQIRRKNVVNRSSFSG